MDLQSKIFSIKTDEEFQNCAIETFRKQHKNVKVYAKYVSLLGMSPESVDSVEKIPFLPIQFFKSHNVLGDNQLPEVTFSSSGTTGTETSRHLVSNLSLYKESFTRSFKLFYGNPEDYCILALLPSYMEREGSSLIYMVEELVQQSNNPNSGFFLNQLADLARLLEKLDSSGQKVILIGVSFALLDLAEKFSFQLKNTIVMETGGMKGRRKEMVREELHGILCKSFGVSSIHSEYGMTELLSQAYSSGKGTFRCPPWMQIRIRDPYDPFSCLADCKSGAINVIDLANQNSCSFIQTDDLGRLNTDGSFEVLGRMDNAQIRGCNLLV
ncbi:MAG TPA: acyltransferase [Tenuifilaceae bacterium]|nr:acyltransferase [Tenuifilaceae bacterium]HPE17576.1 acyltransferase [Tenuifilaceae bacterium]HPQ34306.1 acyltransferase [Tenuifilaceae bacterium]HRX67974.1 acyltransferase [Tenuifilaceae bacterium]